MSNSVFTKLTEEQLGLKPGDLITACSRGIHKIISIGKKGEYCSTYLVTYRAVLTTSLVPSRNNIHRCDLMYCKKVDGKYLESVKGIHASQIENLTKAIENAYGSNNVKEQK